MKKFGASQTCPIGMKSRTGSQRKVMLSEGLVVKNVVTNSHVYPSGAARARSLAAQLSRCCWDSGSSTMIDRFTAPPCSWARYASEHVGDVHTE